MKKFWVIASLIGLGVVIGATPAVACGSRKCHTTTTTTTVSTTTSTTVPTTTTTALPITTTTQECPYECDSMGEDTPQTSSTSIVKKNDTGSNTNERPSSGRPMKMTG